MKSLINLGSQPEDFFQSSDSDLPILPEWRPDIDLDPSHDCAYRPGFPYVASPPDLEATRSGGIPPLCKLAVLLPRATDHALRVRL